MKRIILLGAGASVDAGVPAAIGMTEKMISHFKESGLVKELKVLTFIVGGLLFKAGMHGENPSNGVNVEEVFSAIELLASRNNLEIFPFVGQWHPFIDELEKSQPKSMGKFWQKRDIASQRNLTDLIQAIEESFQEALKPPTGAIFKTTNKYMLSLLCRMVWIEDIRKVRYLFPLVNYASKYNLTIATLNYDNTIELSAESNRIPVNTGIDSWIETGKYRKPDSGIELIKMHGSIDWKRSIKAHDKTHFPQTSIVQVTNDEINRLRDAWVKSIGFRSYTPGIVFGAGNKLSAEGPFLEFFEFSKCG